MALGALCLCSGFSLVPIISVRVLPFSFLSQSSLYQVSPSSSCHASSEHHVVLVLYPVPSGLCCLLRKQYVPSSSCVHSASPPSIYSTLSRLFWLHWVFVAVRGVSLVAASGGYSPLRCTGFSLRWLLLLRSTGSRRAGFSSHGARAQ